MSVLLGAIADDFTGATDLANTLVRQGMRVLQLIGVPADSTAAGDANAVVVALKSRTSPSRQAVSESLAALQWLRANGARQIVFKYCSTFDSTAEGNIGPVADALLEALDARFAFVCPAFPANGRSIYQGYLFVGEQLLAESAMRHHPLTPMRDSCLPRLMDQQSRRRCGLITLAQVRAGPQAMRRSALELEEQGYSYAVVDAIVDEDLLCIGTAAEDCLLVTGGSGVALGLADNFRRQGLLKPSANTAVASPGGRALVLAGSCSVATRGQIGHVLDRWPAQSIDVDALAAGEPVCQRIVDWTSAQDPDLPVLIYASADPDEVEAVQSRLGAGRAGSLVEKLMGDIACSLVEGGFRRLVIAGGETSGAVVEALGIRALRIGTEIDPGVPWTSTLGDPSLALALKSGNFGGEDFFPRAFEVLA